MAYTNLDLCTDAARIINMIDEVQQLSPEQGAQALIVINDMMADFDEDGIELKWYPQTDLVATAPVDPADARCVKLCLGKELALRAGLTETLPQELKDEMDTAYDKLSKRTIEYFEADMTGLPIPQGSYAGGGRST